MAWRTARRPRLFDVHRAPAVGVERRRHVAVAGARAVGAGARERPQARRHLVQPRPRRRVVRLERDEPHVACLVVERQEAVGEHQRRVGRVGAVRRLAAALRLQLIAEVADIAAVEVERQRGGRRAPRAELVVEVGQQRPVGLLDPTGGAYRHAAARDVVRQQLRERAAVVAHEREAPACIRRRGAAVEPERDLAIRVQRRERVLGVERQREPAVAHDRLAAHEPLLVATQARAAARRGGQREVAEVAQQPRAVLGADRLGMELHAPQRRLEVAHAHQHAVVGPRERMQSRRQLADDERVVAHDLERRRDPLEQVDLRVVHDARAPVHRLRRGQDRRAVQVAQPLVPEADAEHRHPALADRRGADAEVARAFRPPGAGRDDDRAVALRPQRRPRDGVVVAQQQRRLAVAGRRASGRG